MKYSQVLAFAGLAAAQSQNLTQVLGANNKTLSTLTSIVSGIPSLLSALGSFTNITILAPDNDAFSAFLNASNATSVSDLDQGTVVALLTYHVLNGTYNASDITDTPAFVPTLLSNATFANVTGGQVVEAVSSNDTVSFYSGLRKQSNVTKADIAFSGGVIHVINSVLEIPLSVTNTAIQSNLSALAGAVTEAKLGKTLDTMKNVTVFAPNNQAFADIGSITGNLSTEALSSILTYHVVEGTIGYSSTLKNMTLTTVGGEDINITVVDGDVFVDSARVVLPDVLVANGVVHVIDSVLNPNATGNATEPNPSTTRPAFAGASTASDGAVPFTSGVPEGTAAATGVSGGNAAETSTSTDAGPRATAAIALGALFGGAVMVANGLN